MFAESESVERISLTPEIPDVSIGNRISSDNSDVQCTQCCRCAGMLVTCLCVVIQDLPDLEDVDIDDIVLEDSTHQVNVSTLYPYRQLSTHTPTRTLHVKL